MSADESDINYLNGLIKNINNHLDKEVFELRSTEGYEPECVDILQEGAAIYTYTSFEDAALYLEGVENGILLTILRLKSYAL